jgi:Protein of unknown function, DUF547
MLDLREGHGHTLTKIAENSVEGGCGIPIEPASSSSPPKSNNEEESAHAHARRVGRAIRILGHRRCRLWVAILLLSSHTNSIVCRAFCPPRARSPPRLRAARLKPLAMWDFLAPARYALEKAVASKSIPNVSEIKGRVKLQDFFEKDEGEHFDHSLWTKVLQRHVTPGLTFGKVEKVNAVDYESIGRDDDFWAYLKSLEQVQPDRLSKREQLAFWMNAYNALCIATIVHHETTTGRKLESITKLSSAEKGPVWDQAVPNCRIAGKDISLNDIEHEQLRAVWAEPALHGCIVCASASCPNLRAEAFVPDKLLDQMSDQMRDWVSNPTKGLKLTTTSPKKQNHHRLELSRIFLWFEEDFGGLRGLKEWLPQFIDDPKVTDEALESATVRYFEYDWQINRAPASAGSTPASAAPSAATGVSSS